MSVACCSSNSSIRSFLHTAQRQCRYSSTSATTTHRILPLPRLDYRAISENVVYKSNNALNRKAPLPHDAVQSVARNFKEFKTLSGELNSQRNARSVVGERIKRSATEKNLVEKEAALAEALKMKESIIQVESTLSKLEEEMLATALALPNDTHPSSPLGPESAAVLLSTHGPPPIPATPKRDHVTIAQKYGLLDLEKAATVTGNSWYYLINEAALLELALTNYALSVAIKHGFTPVMTPDVVRSDIAGRCGFHPRDHASQTYHIQSKSQDLILAATAEIPLAGMFANHIQLERTLPIKVAGVGHAFRAEAGARGADTRGLYRVHQFTKVELFVVSPHDESEQLMEDMKNVQISILSGLNLSFRVLDMPSEELGASAYRKYDMEAWMPGRGTWGEVSSLSNCTDYQSRRLHIRYRESAPNTTPTSPFAHTLNGTAAAIPRLIVALLENGAIFDDRDELIGIALPEVLRPFWIGESKPYIQWQ